MTSLQCVEAFFPAQSGEEQNYEGYEPQSGQYLYSWGGAITYVATQENFPNLVACQRALSSSLSSTRNSWRKWVITHKNVTIQLVGLVLKEIGILATRASEARFWA